VFIEAKDDEGGGD